MTNGEIFPSGIPIPVPVDMQPLQAQDLRLPLAILAALAALFALWYLSKG